MNLPRLSFSRSVTSPANCIFIIDCLSDTDKQSGRQRYDGILDELIGYSTANFDELKRQIIHYRCPSLDQLMRRLNLIQKLGQKGVFPLIFIDGHGDRGKGLMLPSNEFMSWKELLGQLGSITSATGGELTVIAAFCHSMAAIGHLNKSDILPFSFYYGYQEAIPASIVEEETQVIYENLLHQGGLRLRDSSLKIESYSEYDHVIEAIAVAFMLAKDPNYLASKVPELSRGRLRKAFEKALIADGIPLSGATRVFNNAVRSSTLLTEIIKSLMHDTLRRERLISEVVRQLNCGSGVATLG